MKRGGEYDIKEEVNIKKEETLLMYRQWSIYLQRSGISGRKVVDAVTPHFQKWMERKHGSLEFRMVQLLTGHGSFGAYVYRIEKLDTYKCPHCEEGHVDSADHTIQECDGMVPGEGRIDEVVGDGPINERDCRENLGIERKLESAYTFRGRGDAPEGGMGAREREGREGQMWGIECGAFGVSCLG